MLLTTNDLAISRVYLAAGKFEQAHVKSVFQQPKLSST